MHLFLICTDFHSIVSHFFHPKIFTALCHKLKEAFLTTRKVLYYIFHLVFDTIILLLGHFK